jgi:hypothetical protein
MMSSRPSRSCELTPTPRRACRHRFPLPHPDPDPDLATKAGNKADTDTDADVDDTEGRIATRHRPK